MPSMTDETQQNEGIISVRDLRLRFGEREILHGISFDVRRNETLVILGGSGSGKSTLLRALVSLEKPSAGEIWVKGKNIAQVSGAEMDENLGNVLTLRSEEHTSELQSLAYLVCRLLLEKKK